MVSKMVETTQRKLDTYFSGEFEVMGKNKYIPLSPDKFIAMHPEGNYLAGGILSTNQDKPIPNGAETDELVHVYIMDVDDEAFLLYASVYVATGTGYDLMKYVVRVKSKTSGVDSFFKFEDGEDDTPISMAIKDVMKQYYKLINRNGAF